MRAAAWPGSIVSACGSCRPALFLRSAARGRPHILHSVLRRLKRWRIFSRTQQFAKNSGSRASAFHRAPVSSTSVAATPVSGNACRKPVTPASIQISLRVLPSKASGTKRSASILSKRRLVRCGVLLSGRRTRARSEGPFRRNHSGGETRRPHLHRGSSRPVGDHPYSQFPHQRPAAPSDLVDEGALVELAEKGGAIVESIENTPWGQAEIPGSTGSSAIRRSSALKFIFAGRSSGTPRV